MIKLLKPLENYSHSIWGGGATNLKECKNLTSKISTTNFYCFFILFVYSSFLAKSHKADFCNNACFSLLLIFLFFTLISILSVVILIKGDLI